MSKTKYPNVKSISIGDKVIYKYSAFPDDPVNGVDEVIDFIPNGYLCIKRNGDVYTAHYSMVTLATGDY